ncbi:hypothetical protein Pint_11817 [Pistacia integerrima]|uniref:Uncharacterized protein n=1 Tax=Pistacia integerrima TaxID=434235 RepID=A0ACC0XLT0_9ROSI|nr:hypothetical protein Pint_11817 [Pistacia integerrima]
MTRESDFSGLPKSRPAPREAPTAAALKENSLAFEFASIAIALCTNRRGGIAKEVQTRHKRDVRPRHVSAENTALEVTGTDRPGLMSEISAVLHELGCHVPAAVAWTHNTRSACISYIEDGLDSGPITDPDRLAHLAYVVFHAAVSSKGSFADREYFIRHKDGCTFDKESERKKLTQCLMAAPVKNKVDGTTQLCFKVDGDCSYTSRAGTLQPRKRGGLYQEVKTTRKLSLRGNVEHNTSEAISDFQFPDFCRDQSVKFQSFKFPDLGKDHSVKLQKFENKCRVKLDAYSFGIMIKGCCEAGDLNKGFEVFHQLEDLGWSEKLFDKMGELGNMKEASKLFKSMSEMQLEANDVVYNIMIHGYCKEDNSYRALRLANEMGEKELVPNVASYSFTIGVLCKDEKWQQAEVLLNEMIESGLKPSVSIYDIILEPKMLDNSRFQAFSLSLSNVDVNGLRK